MKKFVLMVNLEMMPIKKTENSITFTNLDKKAKTPRNENDKTFFVIMIKEEKLLCTNGLLSTR